MNKSMLISLILMLSIAFTGAASATDFEDLALNGDCEGWTVSGEVVAGDYINLTYTIGLYEGMTLIEEYSGSELIYRTDPMFSFNGIWASELCGEYYVKGTLVLSLSTFSLTEELMTPTFVCECTPEDVCTGTPGYWKNHADAWPVDALKIGGATYSKDDLLDIFSWKPKNNRHIKLFHHLVAAKLNIISGATCDGIDDAVAMADDFFMLYPLGTDIDKGMMDMIDELKEPLEMFNESNPCGEGIEFDEEESMLGAGYDEDKTSWGAVKSIYK
ncbi:MAG: hypothetical protein U5O15_03815 [Candidatus Krumholzibacteriota bacterium]|nr:hypothetical protein [Candidatus Krumholzibacteriota bacterium]